MAGFVVIYFGLSHKYKNKIRKEKKTKKLKYKKIKNLFKIKKYISKENMKNTHKFTKDWLERIKLYKVGKIDNPILTNEDSNYKRKFNLGRKFRIGCLLIQLEFVRV
jgi:uncharacterized membrane protein YgaE (UPF0421/DUF939 family)